MFFGMVVELQHHQLCFINRAPPGAAPVGTSPNKVDPPERQRSGADQPTTTRQFHACEVETGGARAAFGHTEVPFANNFVNRLRMYKLLASPSLSRGVFGNLVDVGLTLPVMIAEATSGNHRDRTPSPDLLSGTASGNVAQAELCCSWHVDSCNQDVTLLLSVYVHQQPG